MTIVSADEKNIYVSSKVNTSYWLKISLLILNVTFLLTTLFVVYETKHFFAIALPLFYILTIGKYLLWNIYGEEFYVISTTNISYQHNYGVFKTSLKSFRFDVLENIDDITRPEVKETNINFISYNETNNLPESVFYTTIKIEVIVFLDIISNLELMKEQSVRFIPFSEN